MSNYQKKRNHKSLKHPCSDLAAIWGLQILLDLKGWKRLTCGFSSLTGDGDLLRTIGLEKLEDKNIKGVEFIEHLAKQQKKFEQKKPQICPKYKNNLAYFCNLIGLSKPERKILNFAVTLQTHTGLDNIADTLDNINANGIITVLSYLLNLSEKKVQVALGNKGLLNQSGILRFSKGKMEKMGGRLNLMDGLASLLFSPQKDGIFDQFFLPAKAAQLKPEDYSFIDSDYQLIKRYLQQGYKSGLKGINILIHGAPGTGKSELAHTLSADLGLQLYEVSTTDADGESIEGKNRFAACQLTQQVLSKREQTLILFDEIEDVFPASDSFFGKIPGQEKRKAWINKQLEENPVPALWISNDIEQIDNAYIRRFDFVLNLQAPPRKVRSKMFEKYLQQLPVSKRWIQQAANNEHFAPALIARAAKVVSMIHQQDHCPEQALEKVLGNTLEAMGYSERLIQDKHQETLSYRLDALNPDYDVKQLMQGLKSHPHGRLCLYGPPGTGKTEFGRFIAKQLGQPLMVKRASDILNAYLGGTEKQIANMFKQANRDHSVLLLDEADSFLQNRGNATHNWEITQVNELLTQMESFDGLFICSTNLVDSLDAASIRRFDLKIKFDYLQPEQAWRLFQQVLKEMQVSIKNKKRWQTELGNLKQLTPGDFATVVRQNRFKSAKLHAGTLLESLSVENGFKQQSQSRGIGFNAEI